MSRKANKSGRINMAVPVPLHRELRDYADSRFMKLRDFPAVMWEGFKMLSPEQVSQAQEQASRFAARRSSRRRDRVA